MKPEDPVRIALVGCGAVARQYYAPALRELEKADLASVQVLVDPSPESRVQLADIFPRAVNVATTAPLARGDLDLAIIASPPSHHAEQTIEALACGLAVLCEKPMATSLAEGRAMVEAAAKAQRPLAVGLVRRFFPAVRTIRDLVTRRVMGDVKSVHVAEGQVFRWPIASSTYFRPATGGGLLLDTGVHVIDLLTWWLGPPETVLYEDDAMGGAEANCRIEMTFAGGVKGHVRLSRDWPLSNRCVIQCERGWMAQEANEAESVQLGFADTPFILGARLHEPAQRGTLPALGGLADNFHRSFLRQLGNVVAAVRGRELLAVPGEQGLRSLEIIERCHRTRRLMAMPWLDGEEVVNARRLARREDIVLP